MNKIENAADQKLLAQIINAISNAENEGNIISRRDVWTIAANITGKPKQLSDNLFAAVRDLAQKFPHFPRAGFKDSSNKNTLPAKTRYFCKPVYLTSQT